MMEQGYMLIWISTSFQVPIVVPHIQVRFESFFIGHIQIVKFLFQSIFFFDLFILGIQIADRIDIPDVLYQLKDRILYGLLSQQS